MNRVRWLRPLWVGIGVACASIYIVLWAAIFLATDEPPLQLGEYSGRGISLPGRIVAVSLLLIWVSAWVVVALKRHPGMCVAYLSFTLLSPILTLTMTWPRLSDDGLWVFLVVPFYVIPVWVALAWTRRLSTVQR
jgi:hypothetical protein